MLLEAATDSQAAAALLVKGACTASPDINAVLEQIEALCSAHGVFLLTRWVPRGCNGLADALSHPDRAEEAVAARRAAGPPAGWWDRLRSSTHTPGSLAAHPTLVPQAARASCPHGAAALAPRAHTTRTRSSQERQ